MLYCLIVDDELIARKGIEKYIAQIDFLSPVASVRTAGEAKQFLQDNKIDIMVLDIQMPQQSGLDFLTTLANPPVTIIITAYPEYALQGYELDVIDYIVKPVPFERFYKAVSKADEFLKLKKRQTKENPDYFFVKADGKIEKILFDDVLFIEAHENYSSIHTKTGKFMVLVSLKNLEASLNKEKFMRVHKSFIVSISRINSIEGNTVLIDTHKVTVSRDIRQTLIAAWTKNELVRR